MEENKKYNINIVVKNDPEDDDFTSGTYTLKFENSIYRIVGNYLIIEKNENNEIIGHVFDLKTIKSYKIWE